MGDTLREQVAGELRARLAFHRMSAAELARRLGWSQSYMARRIDGRNALDLDDLERIAEVLGVRAVDLMPHERKDDDQGRWVRVTYPVAAGLAPKPITRGGHSTGPTRPPTFGQRSSGRKIDNRPAGHPTVALRGAA